jgi:hypothetical protein
LIKATPPSPLVHSHQYTAMIAHASKALISKLGTKISKDTATRTFSSMSWSTSSYAGDAIYKPLSSLQEALYPSDVDLVATEPLDDPRSYGYRVVFPPTRAMDASISDHQIEHFGMNRPMESFMQESVPGESYYNASFRPEVVDELIPISALSPLEKAAVMESHRDWDAQLLEEEIMRFVVAD